MGQVLFLCNPYGWLQTPPLTPPPPASDSICFLLLPAPLSTDHHALTDCHPPPSHPYVATAASPPPLLPLPPSPPLSPSPPGSSIALSTSSASYRPAIAFTWVKRKCVRGTPTNEHTRTHVCASTQFLLLLPPPPPPPHPTRRERERDKEGELE